MKCRNSFVFVLVCLAVISLASNCKARPSYPVAIERISQFKAWVIDKNRTGFEFVFNDSDWRYNNRSIKYEFFDNKRNLITYGSFEVKDGASFFHDGARQTPSMYKNFIYKSIVSFLDGGFYRVKGEMNGGNGINFIRISVWAD